MNYRIYLAFAILFATFGCKEEPKLTKFEECILSSEMANEKEGLKIYDDLLAEGSSKSDALVTVVVFKEEANQYNATICGYEEDGREMDKVLSQLDRDLADLTKVAESLPSN